MADLIDIMNLSLDERVRDQAKQMLDRRKAEAEIKRGERKNYQNLGGGFIMDNDGNVTPVEGFQEYQKQLRDEDRSYTEQQDVLGQQRALELLQARLAAQFGSGSGGDLKPGSAPEQKAREAERLASEADRLSGAMPDSAVNRPKDIAIDALSNLTPSLGQLAGSLLYGDEENVWRSDADRFDQDVSNLAAGLAVTGFELANKQKWSPRAPGISPDEARQRWENIKNSFAGRADAARGQLPSQQKDSQSTPGAPF